MRILSIPYYRSAIKIVGYIVLALVLGRLTYNAFLVLMVMMGVFYSFSGKPAKAMLQYALFPLFAVLNSFVFPRSGLYLLAARIGTLMMAFALMIAVSSRRGNGPPFGVLYLYLVIAVFCSAFGYAPMVSYLKIINVSFFIGGIVVGLRCVSNRLDELRLLRATMMAISMFVIIGSLMTLPFPNVAYYTSLDSFVVSEEGLEAATEAMMQKSIHLFGGMLNQSQALSPIVALLSGWLFCDMLFVERRATLIHIGMLAIAPFMLYMTRSRTGLLAYAVMLVMVMVYCAKKIHISERLKAKVRPAIQFMAVLMVVGAVVSEIRNGTITKWIMKGNEEDAKMGMIEGFTQSRMGKVEENMYDFKRNPLLGSGFQVDRFSAQTVKSRKGGFGVFSAPVEKSVVPLMVLGETGILGAFFFLAFLISFYGACIRRRYIITLSLFTVFLATNMAEATIFSPAGAGGIEWIISVVGGFTLDRLVMIERAQQRLARPFGW